MASPIVSLGAVSVRRPGALILRRVDLTVSPGEAVALFGGNGSGKTTLLRLVATLVRPSSGSATILGATADGPGIDAIRPRIGLVGHEPALYPNLTLRENLELVAAVTGKEPGSVGAALAAVGLTGAADRRAGRSSNGMRRRTEFARLMITEPDLLLLDEAHVGLDRDAWALVEHLVGSVTRRRGAAMVVAHEESLVRPLASRAVWLADGVVAEESA